MPVTSSVTLDPYVDFIEFIAIEPTLSHDALPGSAHRVDIPRPAPSRPWPSRGYTAPVILYWEPRSDRGGYSPLRFG